MEKATPEISGCGFSISKTLDEKGPALFFAVEPVLSLSL
jgi:hypothetical protein